MIEIDVGSSLEYRPTLDEQPRLGDSTLHCRVVAVHDYAEVPRPISVEISSRDGLIFQKGPHFDGDSIGDNRSLNPDPAGPSDPVLVQPGLGGAAPSASQFAASAFADTTREIAFEGVGSGTLQPLTAAGGQLGDWLFEDRVLGGVQYEGIRTSRGVIVGNEYTYLELAVPRPVVALAFTFLGANTLNGDGLTIRVFRKRRLGQGQADPEWGLFTVDGGPDTDFATLAGAAGQTPPPEVVTIDMTQGPGSNEVEASNWGGRLLIEISTSGRLAASERFAVLAWEVTFSE